MSERRTRKEGRDSDRKAVEQYLNRNKKGEEEIKKEEEEWRPPADPFRKRKFPGEAGDIQDESKIAWGKKGEIPDEEDEKKKKKVKKPKPNFEPSGKLAKEANMTVTGIQLKWNEPSEARRPHLKWRLYPFKGDESLETIPVYRQSSYLFGRDRQISDIPTDHPSCSKQHAVLVFREVEDYDAEDVNKTTAIKPYIIDLESANGTFLNKKRLEPRRYYELFARDVLKFGQSSRDYVLLHDELAD